eukprot:3850550-Amphidinium_carterae.1
MSVKPETKHMFCCRVNSDAAANSYAVSEMPIAWGSRCAFCFEEHLASSCPEIIRSVSVVCLPGVDATGPTE